jgi:hypothetical protein
VAYYIDVFSPDTAEAFGQSHRDVTGFRRNYQTSATRIMPGDLLVCYVTQVSRWCGLLTVVEGPFVSDSPLFVREQKDPFELRFRVTPNVWLPLEQALPIRLEALWSALSFTKDLKPGRRGWTSVVRGPPVKLKDQDGHLLAELLLEQARRASVLPTGDSEA